VEGSKTVLLVGTLDTNGAGYAYLPRRRHDLDDRSPARLLREGTLDETGPQVLAAARAFLVGG
jgi:hypothetical protein